MIKKIKKDCFILMSQGSINQKIRFLGQKVCHVAREQTGTKVTTVCTLSGFQEFFLFIKDRPKMRFFLIAQGSFNPKIRFLGQKVCPVARSRTDTQTDRHQSEYRGHPFRVSGIFPSTFHQGSAQ